jgi:hypothetical protein
MFRGDITGRLAGGGDHAVGSDGANEGDVRARGADVFPVGEIVAVEKRCRGGRGAGRRERGGDKESGKEKAHARALQRLQ